MKKIFSNQYTAAIITGTFFLFVSFWFTKTNAENLWSWFYNQINPLSIFLFIFIIVHIYINRNKRLKKIIISEDNPPKLDFLNYQADVFGKQQSKWSWNYKWNSLNKSYEIMNVKPNCPQCGTQMEIDTSYFDTAECFKCRLEDKNYDFDLHEKLSDIEKEIRRRIINNEFLKKC